MPAKPVADMKAELGTLPDGAAVRDFYKTEVYPNEQERLRANAPAERLDLLFVTCGAQADSVTLGIVASPAAHAVLLHTPPSRASATEAAERLGLRPGTFTLAVVGDGKNPSTLYSVVWREWDARGRPASVGIDMTGGFKSMSAAATIVASVIPNCRIFYLDSTLLKYHNESVWVDQRRLELPNPLLTFKEFARDSARRALAVQNWESAAAAYAELGDEPADAWRMAVAKGFAALDAIDLEAAEAHISAVRTRIIDHAERYPAAADPLIGKTSDMARWLDGIGRAKKARTAGGNDPLAEAAAIGGEDARDLLALLLGLAERRCRARQFDVAGLLAYRVLEGVVQRRLTIRADLNLARVSPEDWHRVFAATGCTTDEFLGRYEKACGHALSELPAAVNRSVAYTALRVLFPNDLNVDSPKQFDGIGQARNRSVLAHGMQQLGEKQAQSLCTVARRYLDAMFAIEDVDGEQIYSRHRLFEVG